MQNVIPHKPIHEVMTSDLITCTPYTNLAEAYEMMSKNGVRRLPVLKESGDLIGIITKNDILAFVPVDLQGHKNAGNAADELTRIIVEVTMAKNPNSVYLTDTVGHAAEIMLDKKIGGLPVIDANNKLKGIITESDIFRLIVKQWQDDNLILSGAHNKGT